MDFSALENIPQKGSFYRKIRRFFEKGKLINKKPLEDFIRQNTHNLTFHEAHKKTKVKIHVTITDSVHQKSRLCNYITTPNLYIWSATMASCSLPYVYGPSRLHYKHQDHHGPSLRNNKTFLDGSIGCDLPMKQVAVLYNISNMIVSQCNPYVIPFMSTSSIIKNHKRYFIYRLKEKLLELFGGEVKLRLKQLKNNGLIWTRLEMPVNLGRAANNTSSAGVPRRYHTDSTSGAKGLFESAEQSQPGECAKMGQTRANHDLLQARANQVQFILRTATQVDFVPTRPTQTIS